MLPIEPQIAMDDAIAASGAVKRGRRQLPFAFAQNHGVLLDLDYAVENNNGEENFAAQRVWYRPGLKADVMIELRRVLDTPLQWQLLSPEQFQQHLSQAFQRGNNEAVQM